MTNIFLAVFKIVFGILGSSGALIADGIHSLSDMITDIFAGIGNIISKKPADYEHPFGHGNAEYLTCLVIGIIIAIMGINVINEGISKGITIPSVYVSLISLTTIIIKLFLWNTRSSCGRLKILNFTILKFKRIAGIGFILISAFAPSVWVRIVWVRPDYC